jgi:CBS domain containing-hemolysin-like protein
MPTDRGRVTGLVTALTLLLGLFLVLLITVATGYFVAQEFAYMAVDRSRLRARAAAGDAGAARALDVTRRTSFMLSGAQLGITVTGLVVGYVAEPMIGGSLRTMLGGVGAPAVLAVTVGAVTALAVSTVIQMLFGELVPKNLAIARPEPLALWLSRSTTIYLAVFGWLIAFFDRASNLLLRLVGIEPVHDVDHSASAQDLEHIVAESRQAGELSPELSDMLDRILDFPNQDVEHAMIPRARADTVTASATVAEVRAVMGQGHSRYPVIGAEPDVVVGVVHLEDVLASAIDDQRPVTDIQRPPLVLSGLMRLPDALAEMQRVGAQLAVVIDEYGGFTGVLTLEDLAEELVGEITDEHDTDADALDLVPDDDGVWLMSGSVHVDEAERALDVDLPPGDYETVAGLVIAQHGRLPEPGDVVDVPLPPDPAALVEDEPSPPLVLRAEVLEVDTYVPSQLRITIVPGPEKADEPAESATDGDHE